MNNGKLLLASAFLLSTVFVGVSLVESKYSANYKAVPEETESAEKAKDFNGASAWWFNLLKDENGQMNPQRMQEVAARVAKESKMHSVSAWPLTFSEIGPDNVGGRTRAICIDRNDLSHMFAGGVSGGLWESHNGGSDWTHVAGSDQYDVLTITTIAQGADGTWYFGTGEGIYYGYYGSGAGGFIGGGIWKSKDGVTFTHLASTGTVTPSVSGGTWASISKMAVDPTNPARIYAGTAGGLMVSSDTGNTWVRAAGVNGMVYDVDVASDHTVYTIAANRLFKSANGDPTTGSFVAANSATGYPQSGMGRAEVAISPSNSNTLYVVLSVANSGGLHSAYMSIDAGVTYHKIAGAGSLSFEPFANGQGGYDMTMAVDPNDEGHIILGGVSLWEWNVVDRANFIGQWTNIARQFPYFEGDPQYVHTDNHMILFHPTIPNKFYIGCDGGIYNSLTNGRRYFAMNKNYRVTQTYDVACDYSANSRNVVIAGCQDNGTQFVNGLGNTAMSAIPIGGGDGGQVDMSFLNPNAMFETVYFGTLSRSANRGNGFGGFYSPRILTKKVAQPSPNQTTLVGVGQQGFANFITPVRLWESLSDPNSLDSIPFAATHQNHSIAPGNGIKTTFRDTLKPDFNSIPEPNASIIPGSMVLTAGPGVILTDNGAGAFSGTGGTGTINYNTRALSVTFNTAPSTSALVKVQYDITYNQGVQVSLLSRTNNLKLYAPVPTTLSSLGPNDTCYIKDIIQTKLAVGFESQAGIFVTKTALDFSSTPIWIKVAGSNSLPDAFSIPLTSPFGQSVQYMKWSDSGDNLYFSDDINNVFRLSNLSKLRDSVHSDLDLPSGAANPQCPFTCTRLGSFNGVVTSIDVDPSNPDNLIVAVSGYTSGTHIYTCNNATTAPSSGALSNFNSVQGNLPPMPVYSCSYDKYNLKHALVGTDFGVYSTDDVTSGSVNWTSQGSTFAHVPTLQIHQSRWNPWNGCMNAGVFYFATHGRGAWKSEVSYVPTGIHEHSFGGLSPEAPVIGIYPNPMSELGHVTFTLSQSGTVKLHVYNLKGQLMKDLILQHVQEGANTVDLDCSDLSAGTYLLSFESGMQRGVSRFVVSK
jgi:hypothetical protein